MYYQVPKRCQVCGSELELWRSNVEDLVFGVEGDWDIKRCKALNCGAAYLDAHLTAEQVSGFYSRYATHSDPVLEVSGIKSWYRDLLGWIAHHHLGYPRPSERFGLARTAKFFALISYFKHAALSRVFWLPFRNEGKLVELGFGNGQTLIGLKLAGWSVLGVEFDPDCIELALQNNLDVVQGDFASAGFERDSLHAVVASHVIEHVAEPEALIADIYAKLAYGGNLVLVTPNPGSFGASLFGKYWRGLEVPRHLTLQTTQSLAGMARSTGFREVKVFGTPLGGEILRQSFILRRGKNVSRGGNAMRFLSSTMSTLICFFNQNKSEEIVLFCEK